MNPKQIKRELFQKSLYLNFSINRTSNATIVVSSVAFGSLNSAPIYGLTCLIGLLLDLLKRDICKEFVIPKKDK